jgi:sodium/bile acid cotransporter 7
VLKRLIPDPFLLYLIGTVVLATFLPARGSFAVAVGWLSMVTIVLLFFFAGAKLAREQVISGLTHWRLHLIILASTFLFFPLVGLAASKLLPGALSPLLWTGMLFICALPSTVQSAIALVSLARGNVPAAIASASASQMLGVVLTPIIMGLMAGAHGGSIGFGGMVTIVFEIVIPFIVGHLARPLIGGWVARNKQIVGLTDRSTIIIAVYGAFSAAVLEGIWHKLPAREFAVLFVADALLLAIGLIFTAIMGRMLGFNREDRITIQFCGTKKSLVQGAPMAKVLFPPAQAGVVLLPLMLFHQMQLMACAWLARRYAKELE